MISAVLPSYYTFLHPISKSKRALVSSFPHQAHCYKDIATTDDWRETVNGPLRCAIVDGSCLRRPLRLFWHLRQRHGERNNQHVTGKGGMRSVGLERETRIERRESMDGARRRRAVNSEKRREGTLKQSTVGTSRPVERASEREREGRGGREARDTTQHSVPAGRQHCNKTMGDSEVKHAW